MTPAVFCERSELKKAFCKASAASERKSFFLLPAMSDPLLETITPFLSMSRQELADALAKRKIRPEQQTATQMRYQLVCDAFDAPGHVVQPTCTSKGLLATFTSLLKRTAELGKQAVERVRTCVRTL